MDKEKRFKISIGTSKQKNAYEAGCEVIKNTLKKTDSKPDFIMLFCTEDYEDNGGLKNFLKGAHKPLSYDVPIVGGSICGFLTNEGCFARGAVALAVSYPNMNISIGYGKNTKRNPIRAAKECLKRIEPCLSKKYKHKLIFTFISGTKNPKIPGVKDTSEISSKILAKLSLYLLPLIQKTVKKGLGKEMQVIEQITKNLPDYNLIHASMAGYAPYIRNFQFCNQELLKDAVVSLVLESDIPFDLDFTTGTKETDKKCTITKISKDKKIIKEIDNKPALKRFMELMNLSKKDIGDIKWTDIAVRNPIAYKKNDKMINRPQLMIIGDYLGCMGKIEKENIFIGRLETEKIIDSTYDVLNCKNPSFGFFSACLSVRDYLGIKVFKLQDLLNDYFEGNPFLVIFCSGEAMYKSNDKLYFTAESFTSAIFHKK